MVKIYEDMTELIGSTPLVHLNKISNDLKGNLIGKVESFNPLGSVKDRIALSMIESAEDKGELKKDMTIVEPTSGNTGIGLSYVSAIKDYNLILTMPENMSNERKKIMRIFGTKLILNDEEKGMDGAVKKAEELVKKNDDFIMLGQFDNPANPEAHRETTANEIWDDTDGEIDCLIAGIGTGGTITGLAEVLKNKDENISIIGLEPKGSPVLTEEKSGSHKIQGIGAGFVPENLNRDVIDEIITVRSEDAFNMSRKLAEKEGILAGISSGAAVYAGTQVGNRKEFEEKNIVVILPDTGERYISTEMYDDLD
ncbi:MAG: cysteine synthase A [Thermoplasmatota archaeon]